ncbi:uncharacterized protein DEA37_0001196 [Paragonimus westermani]|uniref:Uncharacterized protein n=1 Tax=Paragonimus westermani TaxID=34504 RepID=A0A5J4NV60_9TREM|nr:uncharacterized protein DEA37_0001196 [Paragonimus westermani]
MGAPMKDMSNMMETLDKVSYMPSYRDEWTYTVEANAHKLPQSRRSRVNWAAENMRDSAIEVPTYTGTLQDFLETRAKSYPRTTPAPPINRPEPSRETTISSDTTTSTPRPTRPPDEHRPQPEAPRHVELPGKREEIDIKTEMDAKKPRMAGAGEDEGYSSGLAVAKHAHRLFGIHYYKTHVTITRKQHLTIAQYKPGESTISQFYITCLPYQLFEFWTINENGNGYREPAASIFNGFRYCAYDSASIRLSHFVPLQNTLQGSTQTDTPALNTTPYAYIARDTLGILDRIQATTPITVTTLQAQQVKLKSNDYWQTENEEGLLGLSEVQTFHQGQTCEFNLRFQNQFNCMKQQTPIYSATQARYLPMSMDTGDNSVVGGLQMAVKKDSTVTPMVVVPETNYPFIFIFLPYIEKVNDQETIARLYAHILMETSMELTLWSIPDGAQHLNDHIAAKNQLDYISHLYTSNLLYHQAYQFNH